MSWINSESCLSLSYGWLERTTCQISPYTFAHKALVMDWHLYPWKPSKGCWYKISMPRYDSDRITPICRVPLSSSHHRWRQHFVALATTIVQWNASCHQMELIFDTEDPVTRPSSSQQQSIFHQLPWHRPIAIAASTWWQLRSLLGLLISRLWPWRGHQPQLYWPAPNRLASVAYTFAFYSRTIQLLPRCKLHSEKPKLFQSYAQPCQWNSGSKNMQHVFAVVGQNPCRIWQLSCPCPTLDFYVTWKSTWDRNC